MDVGFFAGNAVPESQICRSGISGQFVLDVDGGKRCPGSNGHHALAVVARVARVAHRIQGQPLKVKLSKIQSKDPKLTILINVNLKNETNNIKKRLTSKYYFLLI